MWVSEVEEALEFVVTAVVLIDRLVSAETWTLEHDDEVVFVMIGCIIELLGTTTDGKECDGRDEISWVISWADIPSKEALGERSSPLNNPAGEVELCWGCRIVVVGISGVM